MELNQDNNLTRNYKGEMKISTNKQISLFFAGWLGLEILGVIISFALSFIANARFGSDESALESFLLSPRANGIANFFVYLFLFIALVSILNKDFSKFKDSFKDPGEAIGFAFVTFIAIYIFEILYSQIILALGIQQQTNLNQTTIEGIVGEFPILSIIVFGVVGPFCEEITYRVGLFSSIRKKSRVLSYVATSLIFAFIHFGWNYLIDFSAPDLINELINIPSYIFAGLAFSFVFEKEGFSGSFIAHTLNNLLSIVLIIVSQSIQIA